VSTEDDFAAAQTRVKALKQTPANDELLSLYALYKQGTSGDVSGSRPGMLDFKGRAKYDAWAGKKGTGREAAQKAYVELVAKLAAKYG
jgi:diazepam-binding inhibitor (GABA receptor modulator, acyl-CoA-binding protein)